MLAVGCVWQVVELARSRNGEPTTDPLTGAETVTSAAYACVEIQEMKIAKQTTVDVHKERRPSNFTVTLNPGERMGRGLTINSDERLASGVV